MAKSNAAVSVRINARTDNYERQVAKARKVNDQFLTQVTKVDRGLAKMTAIGAKGFSAVNQGVSAAASAAERGAQSVGQMGASLLGAFAMGGPIALGVTALGLGIGALVQSFKASKEEAERFRKEVERIEKATKDARAEHEKWMAGASAQLDKTRESAERLRLQLEAFRGSASARAQLDNPLLGQLEEAQAKLAELHREQNRIRATKQSVDPLRGLKFQQIEQQIQKQLELIAELQSEITRLEQVELFKKEAANLKEANAGITKFIEDMNRLRAADAAEDEAGRARVAALKQAVVAQEEIAARKHEDARVSAELRLIDELRAAGLEDYVQRMEVLLEQKQRELAAADAMVEKEKLLSKVKSIQEDRERQRAARDRDLEQMRRELQILNAANDAERERLRITHELADKLKEVGSDEERIAAAKELAAKKMEELARKEAEAAERAAAAEREKAMAAEKAAAAKQRDLDITKRFAAVPGTGGLFGFGAGRVGALAFTEGGPIGGGKPKAGGKKKAAAGAGPGGGGGVELPDPVPPIQKVGAAIEQYPKHAERTVRALNELAGRAVLADQQIMAATSAAVAAVGKRLDAHDRDLASFATKLAKLSGAGVAGG